MTYIDITTPIRSGMVHWPGDIDVDVKKRISMENGDDANVTELSMSAHTGTHVDAPLHFIKHGKDVSAIAVERMIGKARIIKIDNRKIITVEELQRHNITEGERIIFLTANSEQDWSMKPFIENYIYLSTDAAQHLVDKKIKTVGIDYLSIAGEENGLEVHRLLLSNEVFIIEGLNLRGVTPGEYELICLPLKIIGADGAPARAFLSKIDNDI